MQRTLALSCLNKNRRLAVKLLETNVMLVTCFFVGMMCCGDEEHSSLSISKLCFSCLFSTVVIFWSKWPNKISFETKTFTFCVEKTEKVCVFSFSASYALQLTFHGQRSEQILEQGPVRKKRLPQYIISRVFLQGIIDGDFSIRWFFQESNQDDSLQFTSHKTAGFKINAKQKLLRSLIFVSQHQSKQKLPTQSCQSCTFSFEYFYASGFLRCWPPNSSSTTYGLDFFWREWNSCFKKWHKLPRGFGFFVSHSVRRLKSGICFFYRPNGLVKTDSLYVSRGRNDIWQGIIVWITHN